jgi:hypothetical protein
MWRMKPGVVAAAIAAFIVTGCAAPQTPPPSATPTGKTTSEIASIVAELKPQIDKTFETHFDYDKVCDELELGPFDKDALTACDYTLRDVRQISTKALFALEASKPWPSELDELTQRTIDDLDTTIKATFNDTRYRALNTGETLRKLRITLDSWKPFGA